MTTTTTLRIPETRVNEWGTVPCEMREGSRDGNWHRGLLSPEQQPVERMEIHRVSDEHGESWRLFLFMSEKECVIRQGPDRTVILGAVEDVPSLNDAIMEAVKVAAIEGGNTETKRFTVFINYEGTATTEISALSHNEAVSKARVLADVGDQEFYDGLSKDGDEYLPKSIGVELSLSQE